MIALGVRIGDHAGGESVAPAYLAPEIRTDELANHARALDQRSAVRLKHLPRQVGGRLVHHEDQVAGLAGRGLELERHQQLEQCRAESASRTVNSAARPTQRIVGEALDQPRLALLHHRFGARFLAHVNVAQRACDALDGRQVEAGRWHVGCRPRTATAEHCK